MSSINRVIVPHIERSELRNRAVELNNLLTKEKTIPSQVGSGVMRGHLIRSSMPQKTERQQAVALAKNITQMQEVISSVYEELAKDPTWRSTYQIEPLPSELSELMTLAKKVKDSIVSHYQINIEVTPPKRSAAKETTTRILEGYQSAPDLHQQIDRDLAKRDTVKYIDSNQSEHDLKFNVMDRNEQNHQELYTANQPSSEALQHVFPEDYTDQFSAEEKRQIILLSLAVEAAPYQMIAFNFAQQIDKNYLTTTTDSVHVQLQRDPNNNLTLQKKETYPVKSEEDEEVKGSFTVTRTYNLTHPDQPPVVSLSTSQHSVFGKQLYDNLNKLI